MPPTTVDRLNDLLLEAGTPPLPPPISAKFAQYLALLQRWNLKTNLTAIRAEDEILRRHFVESILCARFLPQNIVSLLDFGSGAGFPGIPIALIRQEIAVTLADSQNKKVAFLREVVRSLDLPVPVHSGRVETLAPLFGCVTLRAVDNMARALPAAIQRLQPQGWLAIMTTAKEIPALTEVALPGATIAWNDPLPLPRNTDRVLLLGQIA